MKKNPTPSQLPKCPTGIKGFDEIMNRGIPRGRPTLVCGSAGCGKTLLAMEFLVRGAQEFDEPGVFLSFEESEAELSANVRSLGWDLEDLKRRKKLAVDFVHIERSEIEETGQYDLEGLFIRLGNAIDSIRAKRVVLDTIEALFGGLSDTAILRAELRRLFRWLKKKGVTAIITGEKGENSLTRYGFEEYVSDCVIELTHGMSELIATRRMRVVKYRGSAHGTNLYPFLIDEHGISVLPITSLGLDHQVLNKRIQSGIERLDTMMGGKGFYRGSSILVSGTPGTGKTSVASSFVSAGCARGERCLYFAFEESGNQIVRNMRSIGIELSKWLKKGNLVIHASRPSLYGLEMHLAVMFKIINDFKPSIIIIDPISNLIVTGTTVEVRSMLTRVIDHLKKNNITTMFTSLLAGGAFLQATEVGISSLMDTWILLRDLEIGGERNRALYILKSRGMPHSNQMREFLITGHGIDLVDVSTGPEGVLTGTARYTQDAKRRSEEYKRRAEFARSREDLERKRRMMEMQVEAMRAEIKSVEDELKSSVEQDKLEEEVTRKDRKEISRLRKADK